MTGHLAWNITRHLRKLSREKTHGRYASARAQVWLTDSAGTPKAQGRPESLPALFYPPLAFTASDLPGSADKRKKR